MNFRAFVKINKPPFSIGRFLTLSLIFLLTPALWGQEVTLDTVPVHSQNKVQVEEPVNDIRVPVSTGQLQLFSGGYESGERLKISGLPPSGTFFCLLNGDTILLESNMGEAFLDFQTDSRGQLVYLAGDSRAGKLFHLSREEGKPIRVLPIPLWLSLVPPVIAILLALLVKEVVVSLFAGIWAGAFIAGGMRMDSIFYFFQSLLEPVQKYVVEALNDGGHLSIIVFSLLIGGMVALISKNGGMAGVVTRLSRHARNEKSAQFITWLLGIAIFFDDYANTLIVGNTMRPVTDSFRISREKLAYIVDSTAAPVAAIAFITTWIGAELGFIEGGIEKIDNLGFEMSAYGFFLNSLKYSFYPILTLIFIYMIISSGKDYGPMLVAEKRSRENAGKTAGLPLHQEDRDAGGEDLTPVKNAPLKSRYAIIPVLSVILMTMVGLWSTGMDNTWLELQEAGLLAQPLGWGGIWQAMPGLWEGSSPGFFIKLGKIIGNADSYIALLWASFTGAALALIMTITGGIMKLTDGIHTLLLGIKTMLPAIIILTLAWSLALTTDELHTADFLIGRLEGKFNPYLFPPVVFILSAFISFSTGSSWGTMTILYPIVIPTSWAISTAAGLEPELGLEILLNVISVVLAASVLGDHCSPISDTTILSSLASDCPHIDHVRTQLPYALTVGFISLVGSWLSTWLGGGWTVSLVILGISVVVLHLVIRFFGQKLHPTP